MLNEAHLDWVVCDHLIYSVSSPLLSLKASQLFISLLKDQLAVDFKYCSFPGIIIPV